MLILFYIALSKIQLNEFAEAEKLLIDETERQKEMVGAENVHHLDLFYLGVSHYEQSEYNEAIIAFDAAIRTYPNFSDALYYKGLSQRRLGNIEEGNDAINIAQKIRLERVIPSMKTMRSMNGILIK